LFAAAAALAVDVALGTDGAFMICSRYRYR